MMARIECPICNDCLPSNWTGPKCSHCGGSGHVTVSTEEEECAAEAAWEAERDYERMYPREA
jgi:hypothetical protein